MFVLWFSHFISCAGCYLRVQWNSTSLFTRLRYGKTNWCITTFAICSKLFFLVIIDAWALLCKCYLKCLYIDVDLFLIFSTHFCSHVVGSDPSLLLVFFEWHFLFCRSSIGPFSSLNTYILHTIHPTTLNYTIIVHFWCVMSTAELFYHYTWLDWHLTDRRKTSSVFIFLFFLFNFYPRMLLSFEPLILSTLLRV